MKRLSDMDELWLRRMLILERLQSGQREREIEQDKKRELIRSEK